MMNRKEQVDVNAVAKELGYQNTEELCEALWRLRDKGVEELRREDLADLGGIEIDETFSLTDQVILLLKQAPNPFFYQYEGLIVRVNETGLNVLDRILEEVLLAGGPNV